jgi:hypothetical protein
MEVVVTVYKILPETTGVNEEMNLLQLLADSDL